MSLKDELDKAVDGLRRFNEALSEKARNQERDELGRFVASSSGAARGGLAGVLGGLGGNAMGGFSFGGAFAALRGPAGIALAAGGMIGEGLAAGARALTPAASAYAVTGSALGFATSVSQSVLGAVQNNAFGGFLLGATGVSAAMDTNQRAAQAVLSTTEALARANVPISDRDRQMMFQIRQEQERRVTEERAKVAELAGSADALAAAKPAGAGSGFDEVVAAIKSLEETVKSFVGGKK